MNLSIFEISEMLVNANNRSEGNGNGQTLQMVTFGENMRTAFSGSAVKYAIHERRQAECIADGTLNLLWKKTGVTDSQTTKGYGPQNRKRMVESRPDKNKPEQHEDTFCDGWGIFPKAAKNAEDENPDEKKEIVNKKTDTGEDVDEKTTSSRQAIFRVSTLLSSSPYRGDQAFALGEKADGHRNPFTVDQHATRYCGTYKVDLRQGSRAPNHIINRLKTLQALQVGGNHTTRGSEMYPELIAWRFHKEPAGGLYFPAYQDKADGSIDFESIEEKFNARGLKGTYFIAGFGTKITIPEAFDLICKEALEIMTKISASGKNS